MLIIVTGTPGTGKTTYARLLAREIGAAYISGNNVIQKYNLAQTHDLKRNCPIVSEKMFAASALKEYSVLWKTSHKNMIVDSHISHWIPSKYVVLCVVARCKLNTLHARLKKRKYSQEKVKENMLAETFEVCLSEAYTQGHLIRECWVKNDVRQIAKEIRIVERVMKE